MLCGLYHLMNRAWSRGLAVWVEMAIESARC